MQDKPIALVVVSGGVAWSYTRNMQELHIVDLDDIREDGGYKPELPPGIGFEELVKEAGLEDFVEFKEGV